jgi:hypothetical protein
MHAQVQPTAVCDVNIHQVRELILGNMQIVVHSITVICSAKMCTK